MVDLDLTSLLLIEDDTLFCLALTLLFELKSDLTRVDVLNTPLLSFLLERLLIVPLVLFCLKVLFDLTLLFLLLLSMRLVALLVTTPFTSLDTPRLVSNP